MHPYKNNSAYTLVELSVVLVIISLLTAGGLTLGAGMVNQAAHVDTGKILSQIDQSLRDYYAVNGHLPCPAARNLAITDANFGREVATGAACNVTTALTGTAYSNNVRIGMVPVRALGLSDRAAADKYGNRILYAVTRQLTDASVFGASDGAVQVMPASGAAILTDAAYFVWSAGKDHKGAPLYSTASTPTTCSGSALDAENCDDDNVFRDAPFNNGQVTASFFDDHTRWAPKFHLAAMNTSSDTLWAANGDSNLYSVGTDGEESNTNVGIGTDTPLDKLHVAHPGTSIMRIQPTVAGANHSTLRLYESGVDTGYAVLRDGSNFKINRDSGGTATNLTTITAAGNVGIGTSAPTDKLHVNGDVRAVNFKGNGSQLYMDACILRSLNYFTWGACPPNMHWAGGISFFNTGIQYATPEHNFWHGGQGVMLCCR